MVQNVLSLAFAIEIRNLPTTFTYAHGMAWLHAVADTDRIIALLPYIRRDSVSFVSTGRSLGDVALVVPTSL